MSDARFRDLLQRLDTGPGEPRPEFASELWSRIERELRVPAAPLDGEAPLDSEAQPAGDAETAAVSWANERARPRWPRVAVAAVLVVVAGVAIALVRAGGGDESETVTGPAAEPTTVPAAPTAIPDPTPDQAAVPVAPVGWSDAPVPACDAPADHALGPDGVLWVGGLGLQRWDGAWTRFTHEDGLPAGSDFDPDPAFPSGGPCGPDSVAPAVSDVEVGPDGTLWMANGAGISTYDGAEFAVVAPYPGGCLLYTSDAADD